MLDFMLHFAVAYAAATLLSSGLAHAARFRDFAALIRAHGLLPAPAAVAAAAVVAFEATAGIVAAGSLVGWWEPRTAATAWALGSCVAAGCGFWLYVRRLLSSPVKIDACGCSPVSSPLTPASLAPSATLVAVSLVGLLALAVPPGPLAPGPVVLAGLWGVTVAALLVLFPASAPASRGKGAW